jgi:hypothetical protein
MQSGKRKMSLMSNLVANKIITAPYKNNYGQWQYILASCVIVQTAGVHK